MERCSLAKTNVRNGTRAAATVTTAYFCSSIRKQPSHGRAKHPSGGPLGLTVPEVCRQDAERCHQNPLRLLLSDRPSAPALPATTTPIRCAVGPRRARCRSPRDSRCRQAPRAQTFQRQRHNVRFAIALRTPSRSRQQAAHSHKQPPDPMGARHLASGDGSAATDAFVSGLLAVIVVDCVLGAEHLPEASLATLSSHDEYLL
jgi:hypothetical protein